MTRATSRRLLTALLPDYGATLARFAAAIVACVVLTVLTILRTHERVPAPLEGAIFDVQLGIAIGGIAAVSAVLLAASRSWPPAASLALSFAVLAAAVVVVPFHDRIGLEPFLFFAAMALLVGLAPFLGPTADPDAYWLFNQRLAAGALFAVVGAGLFFLGILAIEQSIRVLFAAGSGDVALKWFLPISFLLIAPVTWLALLPETGAERAEGGVPDYLAVAVKTLNRFVLVPLLGVYALVLLAYAARIVVTWQLPANQIGWMVSGFGAIGTLSFLIVFGERHGGRLFVRLFRSLWFAVTVIPVAMLGLAVWVRVDAYGLTPERVLLILVALWLAVLALLFAPRRGRGDIRLIPGLLALLLLATSFDPLTPEAFTRRSQAARIVEMLTAAGLVVEGKMVATEQPALDVAEAASLSSSLAALSQAGGLDRLRPLFAGHPQDPFAAPGKAAVVRHRIAGLIGLKGDGTGVRIRREIRVNASAARLFEAGGTRILGPLALWQVTNTTVSVAGVEVARAGELGLRVDIDGATGVVDLEPALAARAGAASVGRDEPLIAGARIGAYDVTVSVIEAYANVRDGRLRLTSGKFLLAVRRR